MSGGTAAAVCGRSVASLVCDTAVSLVPRADNGVGLERAPPGLLAGGVGLCGSVSRRTVRCVGMCPLVVRTWWEEECAPRTYPGGGAMGRVYMA